MSSEDRRVSIAEDAIGNAIISGDGNIVIVQTASKPRIAEPLAVPADSQLGPNPYVGLSAFHEEDANRFFGREELIDRLWKKLRALQDTGVDSKTLRVLPILGPSGCGKSSLARAGLIPELARRPLPAMKQARVAVLTPGAHPLEALATILARIATDDSTPVAKTREFAEELGRKTGQDAHDGLRRIADVLPGISDSPLVVLVDQFEEVYSLCEQKSERTTFIENLLTAASDKSRRVTVIITLRSDFLRETQEHLALNTAISEAGVIVPAMSATELREAIARPAREAGYELDEATIQLLTSEVEGREGALPLLQFALTRIWEGLADGKAPTETLKSIGGVGGALAGEAKRIFQSLSELDRAIARRAFLSMVQLGEGTRHTRRRVPLAHLVTRAESPAQVEAVIERFGQPGARLVTLSSEGGVDFAELTHEALLEHWESLKVWLDESRNDLQFLRRVEDAAEHWDSNGRQQGSLWRPPDLDLLEQFDRRCPGEIMNLSQEFTEASKHAEWQRWFIGRSMMVATLLFAILAGGFGSIAWWQMREADAAASVARNQAKLAIDALDNLVTDVNQKLAMVPEAGPLRHKLAEETLSRLSEIDASLAGQKVIDRTTMRAARLQGDLYMTVSQPPAEGSGRSSDRTNQSALQRALKAYQRAVQIARELETEQPMDESRQVDLAVSLIKLAKCQLPLNSSAGLATLQEIYDYTQASLKVHPKSKDLMLVRAECLNQLGDFWWRRGPRDTQKSLHYFQEGEEIARRLVKDHQGDVDCRYALLMAIGGLRSHAIEIRDTNLALKYDREYSAICDKWYEQGGDALEMQRVRYALAFANLRLGEALRHHESYQESLGPLQSAAEHYESFLQRAPSHRGARVNLYYTYRNLGDVRTALGHEALSEQAFQKSLGEAEKLAGEVPDNRDYQTNLSIALERLAEQLLRQSERYDNPQAMKLLERKLEVDRAIVHRDGKIDRSHRNLSIAHECLARAYWLHGNLPAAREHLREMLSIRERLFAKGPSDAETHEDYLTALLIIGRCEHGSHDLRGKVGYDELEHLHSGLEFVWRTGRIAIENRQVTPDENKPSAELLFNAARALTYCVQALRSDRIPGPRVGTYTDSKNQSKLLDAAIDCLREYRRGDHPDLAELHAAFAATPLEKHPGFDKLLVKTP